MPDSQQSDTFPVVRHWWLEPLGIALASLVVFIYALNWSLPWETDQIVKAAQILRVAEMGDYFLSSEMPDYYRLRVFPLYYAASAAAYRLIGGPIFTFMNVSSLFAGVAAVLSICYAVRNAFGIRPWWTALVALAMPLVVTSATYGNEAIWAFAFLCLSLWLVTTQKLWSQCLGAALFAASALYRGDYILLIPFWCAWAALFSPREATWRGLVRHTIVLGAVYAATAGLLWAALVRTIPVTPTSFEWDPDYKLTVALLTYPFNPSVVLLGAIGGLLICRLQPRYAITHLLLLIPVLFYLGNLSSPKYVMSLVLFFGIPMAYLLQRSTTRVRVALVALLMVWAVVGVSPFGVFGPQRAGVWILPTYDGPCPVGGYLTFYARAREGFYQQSPMEYIELARSGVLAVERVGSDLRVAGKYPLIAHVFARDEFNRRNPGQQFKMLPAATEGDSRFLMARFGYLGQIEDEELAEKIKLYLEKGQVRMVIAGEGGPFPDVIEVGEQVPEGTDPTLGKRILFAADYYQRHRVFRLPEYIEAYAATTWLPADAAQSAPSAKRIYADEEYVGFAAPVEGGKIFGFFWPGRYFNFKAPLSSL